jgi:hypothetical protein
MLQFLAFYPRKANSLVRGGGGGGGGGDGDGSTGEHKILHSDNSFL